MSRTSKESLRTPPKTEIELDPKYDHYDFPTVAPGNQPGHPGSTTKEQDAQVHQLRAMLEQEGHSSGLDTLTLLRFLRARKFDVQASKLMYVNSCMCQYPSVDLLLGLATTRNGARNLEPMILSVTSNTPRSKKCFSTTPSITTRQIRWVLEQMLTGFEADRFLTGWSTRLHRAVRKD